MINSIVPKKLLYLQPEFINNEGKIAELTASLGLNNYLPQTQFYILLFTHN